MGSTVRPLSEVARDSVEEYLVGVGLDREIVSWKYFDDAFNGDRERGFVLLREAAVVGFLGLIPFELEAAGRSWPSHWLCDWYCAVPGLGGFLMHEAVRTFKVLAAFGEGTGYSRPSLSGFSKAEYLEAGEVFHFPVRLAPVLGKIGRSVPWLGVERWPGLGAVGLPAPRRNERSKEARAVKGIPPEIAPLLAADTSLRCRPRHDFEYLQWQIGRCPRLRSLTCYLPGRPTPPAAVVCWRSAGLRDRWRIVPLARPGAVRELVAVLGEALRVIRSEGASIATGIVARLDAELKSALESCRFVKSRSRLPLFFFVAPGADWPEAEMGELGYLCTDLAYRF